VSHEQVNLKTNTIGKFIEILRHFQLFNKQNKLKIKKLFLIYFIQKKKTNKSQNKNIILFKKV